MHKFCFIKLDGRFIKLNFDDIIYIEANKNYPRIFLNNRSFVALITMKQLESQLPQYLFCRIHRSYIVSIKHISSFDSQSLYVGDKILPLSKSHYKQLQQKLLIIDGEQTSIPDMHFPVGLLQ